MLPHSVLMWPCQQSLTVIDISQRHVVMNETSPTLSTFLFPFSFPFPTPPSPSLLLAVTVSSACLSHPYSFLIVLLFRRPGIAVLCTPRPNLSDHLLNVRHFPQTFRYPQPPQRDSPSTMDSSTSQRPSPILLTKERRPPQIITVLPRGPYRDPRSTKPHNTRNVTKRFQRERLQRAHRPFQPRSPTSKVTSGRAPRRVVFFKGPPQSESTRAFRRRGPPSGNSNQKELPVIMAKGTIPKGRMRLKPCSCEW